MVLNLDLPEIFLEVASVEPRQRCRAEVWCQSYKAGFLTAGALSIYDHYCEAGGHRVSKHEGVGARNHKLIHLYTLDKWELYDLEKNPGEMKNVVDVAVYAQVLKVMREELVELRQLYDLPLDQE